MNDVAFKNMWKEVCFHLKDRSSASMSEELYVRNISLVLEKLGWSHFHGEIRTEQSLHIGSAGTIRPDIIVTNKETNESFIVEAKIPTDMLENSSIRKQLTSYMRQTKSYYGILIGGKIHVFMDNSLNFENDPILVFDLILQNNEQDGPIFTKLFSKQYFGSEEFNEEVKEQIKKLSGKISAKKQLEKSSNMKRSSQLRNDDQDSSRQWIKDNQSISAAVKKDTERIQSMLSSWGKKSPWGHLTKSKSGRIDACLCCGAGMTINDIATECCVPTSRVLDHIHNDLEVGKRNNGIPAKIEVSIAQSGDKIYRIVEE